MIRDPFDAFTAWFRLYCISKVESEDFWDALEGMRMSSTRREHFRTLLLVLFDHTDLFPLNHPAVQICTNGTCFAPE